MISAEEEKFFQYWLKNRERKRKLSYQLLSGLPAGLLIGAGIVVVLYTGNWYERATMEANSDLNAFVLLFAIVCIAFFTGFFYKKYQWDINEQRYKELLHKKTNATGL